MKSNLTTLKCWFAPKQIHLFFFFADVKCEGTGTNVLMSPEHGVFGYGSIDLLAGDEDDVVFNP